MAVYIFRVITDDLKICDNVHWDKATQSDGGIYTVTATYRAKNGFGGVVTDITQFKIDKDGLKLLSMQ